MSKWKHTLGIKKEWRQAERNEITVQELAAVVAKRLEGIKRLEPDDIELEGLICELEEFSEDEHGTKDEFDNIWSTLYDWADQEVAPFGEWPKNKMCWIETF